MSGLRFDENVGPDGSQDYIKGGDTDLNLSLMAEGHRCVFVPEAKILHRVSAEQLELVNLFQGGYRRGRKNAYLYPKRRRPIVLGAPLNLWIKIVKQWLRCHVTMFRGPFERYEAGMKYHYRRGYMRQLRERITPEAR